ncbi:MAG: NAD(P)H-dependent glycerol-3-phosphate dehydrogenase [Verrucomicrobiota bacterium]|jgi:glycerol-3-phosphate dehydrogenase (NAD(P)+)
MKVTVIGAGAWGTTLANLLCKNENEVTLWGYDPAQVQEMERTGFNQLFLPGIPLARELKFQADLAKAVAGSRCAVVALPSKFFRKVTSCLPDFDGIAVSVTKGIECESGLTMSGILRTTMPKATGAALSGPTLAMEVAKETPAAIVAAHAEAGTAREIQRLFHRPAFRVYTSNDVLGVELGGALKNVAAIAAGICDGVGFGDNAKAALITRAIAEMRRLGVACGALTETFSGLSGLGDLVVTCFSHLSRNRQFGERMGRGEKVEAILASTITVAEGYPTALAAHTLARKVRIATPIIDEVHAMLYEQKDIRKAVRDLMSRDMKAED